MAEDIPLPAKAKLHKTYLEGREGLFDTKVLKIREGEENILVFSRDPGSASAIVPVLKLLPESIGITAVVDGLGEDRFRKEFAGSEDITPEGPVLTLQNVIQNPALIVADASSSNIGLETFAAATFPDAKIILLEDYYFTANKYIARLKEMRPEHLPEKICVMSEPARKIVLDEFKELAEQTIVTGQPAFDRFFGEKTSEIRDRVRAQLQLSEKDHFVTYLGTGAGQIDEIRAIVPQLGALAREYEQRSERLVVCFRKHPRDNTSPETYEALFRKHGIAEPIENNIATNDVAAASDAVVTSWSTGGIEAAFRRIPVLYINDVSIRKPEEGLNYPLPPVTLGASLSATSMDNVAHLLEIALNPDDQTTKELKAAMEKCFSTDGGSARRVADVVMSTLAK